MELILRENPPLKRVESCKTSRPVLYQGSLWFIVEPYDSDHASDAWCGLKPLTETIDWRQDVEWGTLVTPVTLLTVTYEYLL